MPISEWTTRLAGEEDIDAVSALLARAFADYPWTRWTVDPDDHESRIEALQRLTLSELALPYGEVWVAVDAGEAIVSAAIWTPNEVVVPPSVWARIGPRQAGLEGVRHAHATEAEAAVRAVRPSGPGYYLGAVGTWPARQRMGFGSAVLRPVLQRLPAERADAYLETCLGGNVAFYTTLGFEVVAEVTVPGGGPQVWVMANRGRAETSGTFLTVRPEEPGVG